MTEQRTHYDVLDVAPDADSATIRAQWRVMLQVWHPDRFDGDVRQQAATMSSRINEAWTVLRDDERRAAYDAELARRKTPTHQPRFAMGMAEAARRVQTPAGAPAHLPPATHHHQAQGHPLAQGAQEFAAGVGEAVRRWPRAIAGVAGAWIVVILLVVGTTGLAPSIGSSIPADDPTATTRALLDMLSEDVDIPALPGTTDDLFPDEDPDAAEPAPEAHDAAPEPDTPPARIRINPRADDVPAHDTGRRTSGTNGAEHQAGRSAQREPRILRVSPSPDEPT